MRREALVLPINSHYVNQTQTDNSFLFSDLMKMEAGAEQAKNPKPQYVVVWAQLGKALKMELSGLRSTANRAP